MTNDAFSQVGIEPERPLWARPVEHSGPMQRFTAAAQARPAEPAAPAGSVAPAAPVAPAPPVADAPPAFAPEPVFESDGTGAEPGRLGAADDSDDGYAGTFADDDIEDEEDEQPEGLDMRVLVEWVDTHIASIVARKVPTTGGYPRWCRQWWFHAEAIVRFESLRHAWMDLIGRPGTAKLSYFRDFLDPTLMTLMADDGPFGRCTPTKHIDHEPIGQEVPPPELFD